MLFCHMSNHNDVIMHSGTQHDNCLWSGLHCFPTSASLCTNMSSFCHEQPICEDCLYCSLQVAMEDPACALIWILPKSIARKIFL